MTKNFKVIIFLFIITSVFTFNIAVSKDDSSFKKGDISFQEKDKMKFKKPIEEITTKDIVKEEPVSQDVQKRITDLINQSQNELDKYRTTIDQNYKKVETKVIDVKKDVNNIYNFRDEIEADLNITKWMIISLSSGIICLTTIIIIMWRSVVNVDRKDVDVMFSIEKIKMELKNTQERLKILEDLQKKDER